MTMVEAICADCEGKHARTLKQVNQAIKKAGVWRCFPCSVERRRADLNGMKFGRWLVTGLAGSVRSPSNELALKWVCKCECGQVREVSTNALRSGHSRSCGCFKDECAGNRVRTHGKTESREYAIWQAMKTRCGNPNSEGYQNYGGRGISVCERWVDSFPNFLSDMGKTKPGESIERIDVNGNYEPTNCKWASRVEQARNTRRNRVLTLNGVSKCLKEWATDLGIDQASLRERLEKWTLEAALTTPKKAH